MMIENTINFRTLNYLGSKLRLLDFIEEQVMHITPKGSVVCDLFAGSGCVSYRLAQNFAVYTCDIQHYSQIICNALLMHNTVSPNIISTLITDIQNSKYLVLKETFMPLIQLEDKAIQEKNTEVLTDIIERGSLEVYRIEKNNSLLSGVQSEVLNNLYAQDLMGKESVISRYYGGVYFSYEQAVQIDIILSEIRKINDESNRNLFMAALLSTVSDIAVTVGKHFAQPIKARDSKGNIKPLVYNKSVKDKTIVVLKVFLEWVEKYTSIKHSELAHLVYQGDYMECLNKLPANVSTIYADPPYTRDHYSRFYHVLETIALDDIPEISTVTINGETHISNGIYRKDRYQSPFCIKSKAIKAFDDMFRCISESKKNLLLSYSPYDESKGSHPRVVTMQQLTELANKYFNRVEVVSAGHFTHNKLNSTEHLLTASNEAEVLIVCTN